MHRNSDDTTCILLVVQADNANRVHTELQNCIAQINLVVTYVSYVFLGGPGSVRYDMYCYCAYNTYVSACNK